MCNPFLLHLFTFTKFEHVYLDRATCHCLDEYQMLGKIRQSFAVEHFPAAFQERARQLLTAFFHMLGWLSSAKWLPS